ncbi:hypothetical protein [Paenibacillus sp. IHBB 3054]|uniref:hypothetical protein n=1 Tax=Paenibacillus sp. IHBB 3054 TaxID=3425689 RepID=UPI003F668A79
MHVPPYGYKKEGNSLVSNPYQAKVVKLIYELGALGLDPELDVQPLLNEMLVPKNETKGYVIEDHWDTIIAKGKEMYQQRLEEKKKNSKYL